MRLALLVIVAAASGSRALVSGASAAYETAFLELAGCHLSFGTCIRLGSDTVNGYVPHTKTECEGDAASENTLWHEEFSSADEFESASASNSITLVRLRENVTAETFQSELPVDTQVESFLFCDAGTYAFVEGGAAPSSSSLFQILVPNALKVNPLVRGLQVSQTIRIRINLTPKHRGPLAQVAARLSARHDLGRRLLELHPESTFTVSFQGERDFEKKVSSVLVTTSAQGNEVEFLSSLPEVASLEPWVPATLSNNEAALITMDNIENDATYAPGEDVVSAMVDRLSLWQHGLNGTGQIVGVGDSGLDTEHLFFADPTVDESTLKITRNAHIGARNDNMNHRKVTQYVAHADGTEGEVSGHGTHVAGTVAGHVPEAFKDACSSVLLGSQRVQVDGADFQGMAPGARIAFFDIGIPNEGSLRVPPNIADMFQPTYDQGGRIHTNSWGSSLSAYLSDSQAIDQYAFEHQDMLILFANSNDGPGLTTLSNQASSKNVVSVGAAQNSRRSAALVSKAYMSPGQQYVCLSDYVSTSLNCAQSMAYFSSNGPTFDRRIKPDVVAPGYYIFSARSAGGNGFFPVPTCDIEDKPGTSMATPVVAGISAIIRQFFVEGFYPTGQRNPQDGFNPMGALVKAVLIDGSEFLRGVTTGVNVVDNSISSVYTVADHANVNAPGPYQGFGRPFLRNTLKTEGSNTTGVRNVWVNGDFANMPRLTRAEPTATFSFDFISSSEPIKATLVWYDPPASTVATKTLVNDLDIKIIDPNGAEYFANGLLQEDRINTVEKVVIPANEVVQGIYHVVVSAHKLNLDDQPFAIVVSGSFAGTTLRPTRSPTPSPTLIPTESPTTMKPSPQPTVPTAQPTVPTAQPTVAPVDSPTLNPTRELTESPSSSPDVQQETQAPTIVVDKDDISTIMLVGGIALGVLLAVVIYIECSRRSRSSVAPAE